MAAKRLFIGMFVEMFVGLFVGTIPLLTGLYSFRLFIGTLFLGLMVV